MEGGDDSSELQRIQTSTRDGTRRPFVLIWCGACNQPEREGAQERSTLHCNAEDVRITRGQGLVECLTSHHAMLQQEDCGSATDGAEMDRSKLSSWSPVPMHQPNMLCFTSTKENRLYSQVQKHMLFCNHSSCSCPKNRHSGAQGIPRGTHMHHALPGPCPRAYLEVLISALHGQELVPRGLVGVLVGVVLDGHLAVRPLQDLLVHHRVPRGASSSSRGASRASLGHTWTGKGVQNRAEPGRAEGDQEGLRPSKWGGSQWGESRTLRAPPLGH